MHLWRIENGRPSWLDAIWISGAVLFLTKTWFWCNTVLNYLEPKGTAYLVLGYMIFLIVCFSSMGGYVAVFLYRRKKLAPVFWYLHGLWFPLSLFACFQLQRLLYGYADMFWPMKEDPNTKPWPIDIETSSKAIAAHVQRLDDASLVISIVFLTLCYALVVACVERFPNFANRVAYYVAFALTVVGLAAKLALAFRH